MGQSLVLYSFSKVLGYLKKSTLLTCFKQSIYEVIKIYQHYFY